MIRLQIVRLNTSTATIKDNFNNSNRYIRDKKSTSCILRCVQNRPRQCCVLIYSHAGALELYRSIFILCACEFFLFRQALGCVHVCVVLKCSHCCCADVELSLSISQFYCVASVDYTVFAYTQKPYENRASKLAIFSVVWCLMAKIPILYIEH